MASRWIRSSFTEEINEENEDLGNKPLLNIKSNEISYEKHQNLKKCFSNFFSSQDSFLRWIILFCVCLSTLGSYYSYDSVAVIATDLMKNLNLSQSQFGLLYSIYELPNIIWPFLSGYFLDRVGIRISLICFISLVTIGTGIVAYSPYTDNIYINMLIGRLIFGLGAESIYVAADTVCLIWFKGKTLALAMGFTSAAGRLAEIFTFNTIAPFSQYYGTYRAGLWLAFFVCIGSLLFGFIMCTLDKIAENEMKKNGIPRIKSIDSPPVSILALKKFPLSFWLLASVLSFNYATIYPFISYASDFLQLKWGYNDEEASQIVSFLSITAMITGPILGYLLDKFGKRIYAINIGNAIQIIACFLMGSTTISPFVPIIAVGFSYSLVPAAIWPSLSIIIEDDVFSSAYGLVSSLACIVLIPVYWFIGELVDQYHKIEESCWLMASFSFIGLCFGVAWQIVDKKNGTLCNLPSAILITNNNKKNNEENLENEL